VVLNRPDQHRLPANRIQHRVQKKRSRRLAVGPCHTGERELLLRMAKEIRGNRCHRATSATSRNLRNPNLSEAPGCFHEDGCRIRHYRRCALVDSFADVAIAVRRLALHGQKQHSRPHPTRVVLDAPNHGSVLRVGAGLPYSFGSAQQFFKAHDKVIVSGFA
jgi:hypothetical protein